VIDEGGSFEENEKSTTLDFHDGVQLVSLALGYELLSPFPSFIPFPSFGLN